MKPGYLKFDASVKSLAYTMSSSLEEFLDIDNDYRAQFVMRLREVRLQSDDQLFFNTYPDVLHLMMLVTLEDPDTLAVLPSIAKLVDVSPRLGLRILRDDADLSLLNRLVDEIDFNEDLDDLDLPQVFIFDEEWQLQEQWGPRPQAAEASLEEWLERHPEYESSDDDDDDDVYAALVDELNNEMRLWYNSGLSQACIRELRALLAGLQNDSDSEEDHDE